jgi:hypothetical protein
MKSLDEIGIAHQTDKASQFSRTYAKPHNYLVHLERFFEPMREHYINLVEIGVGGGESIKTWLEYFPSALVYGVDVVHDTNEWNSLQSSPTERYHFACGNQSDARFWDSFFGRFGDPILDVVIDDGSHYACDIRKAFTHVWPHVRRGGIYVVEDLNFDHDSRLWTQNFLSYIHEGTTDVDSITFSRELCVIRKK